MKQRTRRVLALAVVLVAGLVVAGDTSRATFSGTNGRILFVSSEGGCHAMNSDGTLREEILGTFCGGGAMDWSPDGSKVAFVSFLDFRSNLYTANLDGTGLARLTNANSFGIDNPSWAPNGQRLAFEDFDGSSTIQIFTVNADGTSRTQITSLATPSFFPAIAPNGTTVAFIRNNQVYTMDISGSGQAQRTSFPSAEPVLSLDWKPDGTQLAIEKTRPGDFASDIYTITLPSGSGDATASAVNVTNSAGIDEADPSWSPDSTKILFDTDRDGNRQLYTINPNGTGLLRMTNNFFADFEADWGVRATAVDRQAILEPGIFNSISPVRLVDTRNGTGGRSTPIGGEQTVEFTLAGVSGIPAGATSVTGVATVVQPKAGPGFLTMYDKDPRPTTSITNFVPNQNVATFFTIKLSGNKVKVYNGSQGNLDLVIDITGYAM